MCLTPTMVNMLIRMHYAHNNILHVFYEHKPKSIMPLKLTIN
jgi:hypothetical protein